MAEPFLVLASGIVPRCAKLAPAPDVGDNTGPAALKPQLADRRAVVGQLRNAEPAIARKMDRRLAGLARWPDLDIGDAGAVLGDRFMPGHDEAGRVEGLRRTLQEQRGLERRNEIKRRRGQRVLRAGQELAGRLLSPNIERPNMSDADVGQAGDALPCPAGLGRGQHFEVWLQVVEDRQDEPAAAPEEPLQRAALTWLEQFGEMAFSREKGRKGNAEHGVRRVGLAINFPRGAPPGCEPAAVPLNPDIGREIDPGLGTGLVANRHDGIEKAKPLDEPDTLVLGLTVDISPDGHALGARLEYDRGFERVGSTPPQPYRASVTRAGRHALAPRRGEQQGVAIEPGGSALGLRQGEASRNEVACGEIEFAQHNRVGAAARQHQDGAVMTTRDRHGAAPGPVLALPRGQSVERSE